MKYTIKETKFGLYQSYDEQGNPLTMGLTYEDVDRITKNIRIPVLRNEWDGVTSVAGKAVVDGKL